MKNATKHAEQLKSLSRKLIREYKPDEKKVLDPLPALVRGAMSFDVSDSRANEIMRGLLRAPRLAVPPPWESCRP